MYDHSWLSTYTILIFYYKREINHHTVVVFTKVIQGPALI